MMHLSVDQIIDFVSFDSLEETNMKLAQTVNGHILTCSECREKVKDFQSVFDELVRRNADKSLAKMYIKQSAKEVLKENNASL